MSNSPITLTDAEYEDQRLDEKTAQINSRSAEILQGLLLRVEEDTLDDVDFIATLYAHLVCANLINENVEIIYRAASDAAASLIEMTENNVEHEAAIQD
jgi:hypothetical protein